MEDVDEEAVVGPQTLLLESVTPATRHALIKLRVMAMSGDVASALKAIAKRIGAQTAAGREIDVVALAMLKSEILHYEHRQEEANNLFDEVIRPRLGKLGMLQRLAVRQNYVDLGSEPETERFLKSVQDFYHLYDLRQLSQTDLQDDSEVADGLDAAGRNDYREAMASFWREALRTYRQGAWNVHRQALIRLGHGWLSVGEPVDAAFCAILSGCDRLADRVSEDVLKRRDREVVQKVVSKLVSVANLRDHFCAACTILTKISDTIPDALVPRVAEWLLERCQLPDSPRGSSGPLSMAWKALESLAPRLTPELARKAVDAATQHSVWQILPTGRILLSREKMVEVVNSLVHLLPVADMEILAHKVLPLAIERRQDNDYGDVLNLLSHISYRGKARVNSTVGSALFAPGRPVDHLLAQLAPTFGKSIFEDDRLQELALRAAQNTRRLVQRRPIGEGFQGQRALMGRFGGV